MSADLAEFADQVTVGLARDASRMRHESTITTEYVTNGADGARMGMLRLAWDAQADRVCVPPVLLMRVSDAARSFANARYHEWADDRAALRAANGWGI